MVARRLRRMAFRRRGISYILSVIMMTLVMTALSASFLFWGLDQVGQSRAQFASSVRTRIDRIQERIVVEDASMLNARTLRVYVRNVGATQVVIDQMYVDRQAVTLANAKGGGAGSTRLSLAIQETNFVDVTIPAGIADLAVGQSHLLRVATNRGTTSVATWTL